VKRLSNWDTYVQEAMKDGDRSVELPLTDDESYVITYPTRKQGREIAKAQREGDTDALLVAMLGEAAGTRVRELSEDWPAFVLDAFLLDVMKKLGMIPEDEDPRDEEQEFDADIAKAEPATVTTRRNGKTPASPGKAPAKRRSNTTSRR
jgi:hypothetical protein